MKRLWIIVLLTIIVSCASDNSASQEHIRSIVEENQILHDVNDNLRMQLVLITENASRDNALANLCINLTRNVTDIPSPVVRVPLSDILVGGDKVVIHIPDVQHGIVAASKSMDPIL